MLIGIRIPKVYIIKVIFFMYTKDWKNQMKNKMSSNLLNNQKKK